MIEEPARGIAPLQDAWAVLKAAGERAAVPTAGAALIRDGTNVLFRLTGGVVARIGLPGSQCAVERQIQASRWLDRAGVPVVRLVESIEQPTLVEGRPVTWWVELPAHRHATPAELGSTLRRLHNLEPPDAPSLPAADPFDGLRSSIDGGVVLSGEDRGWLKEMVEQLRADYRQLVPNLQPAVIHGDAWQGNVAVPVTGGDPVLLDLDHLGIGPREWDLVSLAVDYTDFARITESDYRAFVAAYGGYDMTTWPGYRTIAAARELRWTLFAVGKANSSVKAAEQARHRVACLKGEIVRPWTWSAL
ncbi:phosphotransferase enzyme family protein [Amycolatopsis japonica]|uniref:phosphotransferase enzyme family protein n=1 Tax=Amycolatopsis japonica TaxID=208439 RepID=UPI00366B69F4